jgi:putative ABC transport system permease protein
VKTIKSVFSGIARSPLKSILTFITVGLGVGVVICALSLSSSFDRLMESQLEKQGVVVNYANAELSVDGELEVLRPSQSDSSILDIISSEVSGVQAVSPIVELPWSEFLANGSTYRIRTVYGVNEQYISITGLEPLAGSLITADDVAAGAKNAVIVETLAEILYGSAEAAVGQILQPPTAVSTETSDQAIGNRMRAFSAPTFTIVGVVSDPTDLQREAYGIADMAVPYTAAIPSGFNASMATSMFLAQGMLLTQGVSYETVSSQLQEVLTRNYGDDFVLEVWEGGPGGATEYLSDMRGTVETFSLIINLLGFILLAAASIGILSIMLVEALGRTREIAIERALGASVREVLRDFFARSVLVSSISTIIGIGLAFVLSGPLTALILPIFSGVSVADLGSVINPQSILIGATSALVIGSLFGVLPVFTVARAGIADTIREG